jgi:heptosyltransferase-2
MRKRSAEEIRGLIQGKVAQTSTATIPSSAHQIHDFLNLVGALGAETRPLPPQLAVTDLEVENFRKRFAIKSGTLLVGINAGAEYGPAKRWPVENFIAAAHEVWKQIDCGFLVFGGKGDMVLADEIEKAISGEGATVHNLAGKTNLRELCAGLKLCRVILTNDTGPMHVAAAVGTAVVVPFGSTSPELTGPGEPGDARHSLIKSAVPCSPCFLRECPIDFRCMKGISVESVATAVARTLRKQTVQHEAR